MQYLSKSRGFIQKTFCPFTQTHPLGISEGRAEGSLSVKASGRPVWERVCVFRVLVPHTLTVSSIERLIMFNPSLENVADTIQSSCPSSGPSIALPVSTSQICTVQSREPLTMRDPNNLLSTRGGLLCDCDCDTATLRLRLRLPNVSNREIKSTGISQTMSQISKKM